MDLQSQINSYQKLNQRFREQIFLSKAYDSEYETFLQSNMTAKTLIHNFLELNGYVIGQY